MSWPSRSGVEASSREVAREINVALGDMLALRSHFDITAGYLGLYVRSIGGAEALESRFSRHILHFYYHHGTEG